MSTTNPSTLASLHSDLAISWTTPHPTRAGVTAPSLYLPHALAAYVSPAGIGVDDVDARKLLKDFAGREVKSTLYSLYGSEASLRFELPERQGFLSTGSEINLLKGKVFIHRQMGNTYLGMENSKPADAMVASAVHFYASRETVGGFMATSSASLCDNLVALAREFLASENFEIKGKGDDFLLVSHNGGKILVLLDHRVPSRYLWSVRLTDSEINRGLTFQLGPKAQALLDYLSTGERPQTHADRT